MCMHVCRETFVTLTAKLGKRWTQDIFTSLIACPDQNALRYQFWLAAHRFPAQSQLQEITTFPHKKKFLEIFKGSKSREEVIVVLFQDKTHNVCVYLPFCFELHWESYGFFKTSDWLASVICTTPFKSTYPLKRHTRRNIPLRAHPQTFSWPLRSPCDHLIF